MTTDFKVGGIYIVAYHGLSVTYYKAKILEETKTTYLVEWMDTNKILRYGKDEFASRYTLAETIGIEPKEN